MFFGHNHGDSWQILYDPDDYVRPVAVAFSGPAGMEDVLRLPSHYYLSISVSSFFDVKKKKILEILNVS